ncbi:MAG: hypothetical protein P1U42_12130 [Phycisphaerales bacterium]|nr:hypothetical protein [Phycisphaerales bacterium]
MFGLPEISISTVGLPSNVSGPRAAIDLIASQGVRGIALDAMISGMRPRELTRSAKRDIAASLRRRELEFTGLDLWIPQDHFIDPMYAQRAVDATQQACEMSVEIASLVGLRSKSIVSLVLPKDLGESERAAIGAHAQRVGATIADHQVIDHDTFTPTPGIGIGIDPTMILLTGQSAGKAITQSGSQLISARLSDSSAMGRCVVGAPSSQLDLKGYAGALIVASQDWVTLDLRQLPEPIEAITQSRQAWVDAGTI